MLYPPINELLDITGNRYVLVNTVSKRARQLVDNTKNSISDFNESKPVSVATLEVFDGKISVIEDNSVYSQDFFDEE